MPKASRRLAESIVLLASVGSLFAACFIPPNPQGESGTTTPASDADVKQMAELTSTLEQRRTEAFDKSALELEAHGNTLYWKTYPGFAPALHRRANTSTTDYSFGIGSGDDNNFHASASLVVTAERSGSEIVYHQFDAAAPEHKLGDARFPKPAGEQKWWAYSVSASATYVITDPSEETSAGHAIWKFNAGAQPAKLFLLEDLGMQVGEIWDFAIDGTTMMLIEQGRLWQIDLTQGRATPMQNDTEISGAVAFESDGVVWQAATGLKYFAYETHDVRNVSAELESSAFKLNDTFSRAHYFSAATTKENFCRFGEWIVYTGGSGIFAYSLKSAAIVPVLLDTTNIRYRYPVALTDGSLFVVGLTSESGVVGADGPVYEVDLRAALAQ